MSATAAQGGAYVPPFATRATTSAAATAATAATTAARATATSVSFASIGGGYGTASGAGTATSSAIIVDSTGGVDSNSLLEYFTKPYIDAHTLSIPTWRYAYILWFVVVGTLVIWSCVYHLSGASHGGSAWGAWFRKYSIRRIAFRGKTKRKDAEGGKGVVVGRKSVKWASPTFAQMAVVVALIAVALCLSLIGPDYISPTTCVFGGECKYSSFYGSNGPPKSTYRVKARRDLKLPSVASGAQVEPALPVPAGLGDTLQKRGVNNPNGWAPFNDPLLASSNRDIQANWWTAAARLGLISYAMLPLAVTFALKQWPFNIWATPFLTAYHFDKTAILHRWSGRVIWLFATGHSGAWLYQLILDKDPFGRPVLVPALQYFRFVSGIVAWGLLTIITAFSFKPIRNRYYELFYWSHVGLLLLFFAACIVHHRPLMWWPIIAALWWGAERFVRGLVFLYINGFHKGILFREPRRSRASEQSFSLQRAEKVDGFTESKLGSYPPAPYDDSAQPLNCDHGVYPPSSHSTAVPSVYNSPTLVHPPNRSRYLPPPGFASAQLLPGRTVRLVLHTPVPVRWRPGQHAFLTIPAVKLVQAHPYTIVSIDERARGIAPIGGNAHLHSQGSVVVMLVRAQKGFSKALWDYVATKRKEKEVNGATQAELAKGINIRSLISWPLGSSARTPWEAYDSLLIICGGTGITFGMSVLEYTVKRMARRDAESKYKTRRVRLVWILREYSHLTWVASALRKCLDLLSSPQLQIDIFVSRDAPRAPRRSKRSREPFVSANNASTDELSPPQAPFARQARGDSPSRDSYDEASDAESDSDNSRMYAAEPDYGGQIESVTDLVLFDGEDDERTAAEAAISTQVRAAGRIRRALSRRGQKASGATRPASYSRRSSTMSKLDFGDHVNDIGYTHPYERSDFAETGSYNDLPFATPDHPSDFYDTGGRDASIRNLVGHAQPSGKRGSTSSAAADEGQMDVTEEDQEDLEIVSEHAKTGYPKLKEIIEQEVLQSSGKTLVACCGPNGLNTLVRHMVSDQIDLGKVLKGDPRGQVSLVVEDFSY